MDINPARDASTRSESRWKSVTARHSILFRAALWSLLLITMSTAFAAVPVFLRFRESLLQDELRQLSSQMNLVAARWKMLDEVARSDVRTLAQVPPIEAIRSIRLDGQLTYQSGDEAVWRQRLATIFTSLMASKPDYLQARLILAQNNGREVVRVERAEPGGELVTVPSALLQEKGQEPYFKAAMSVTRGAPEYTFISWNREHGKRTTPPALVFRHCITLFTAEGKAFGFVVLNISLLNQLINELQAVLPSSTRTAAFVIDQDGRWILPPTTRAQQRIVKAEPLEQLPEAALATIEKRAKSKEVTFVWEHPPSAVLPYSSVMALRTVQLPIGSLVFGLTSDYESVASAADASLVQGLALVLLGAALMSVVGLWGTSRLLRPLRDVTRAIQRTEPTTGETEHPPSWPKTKDELEILSVEFRRMQRRITDNRVSLEREMAKREETERELEAALERTKRAYQELDSFAHAAAHDLRSPLRTIRGFASFLREDCKGHLTEQSSDFLLRIDAGATRLMALVDALLELSTAGQSRLKQEEVDLAELAVQAVSELKEQGRDVEIQIEGPLRVTGDATLLYVVVHNLMSNALKYTGPVEHPSIRFFEMQTEAGRTFCVSDNGAGFDMEKAEQLFEPFTRLHKRTDFEGSGVGLSTVKRVIDRHGGAIWCDSRPGAGASFYFTVPRLDNSENEAVRSAAGTGRPR